MRQLALAALLAPLLTTPAFADGCPEAPDHSADLAPLFERLQNVGDDKEARQISNQMWSYWTVAPDPASQMMLDEGMGARAGFDYDRAMDRFNALVSYCPFYAEGYNQRAFIHFLREDFAAALPDLQRALDLNPQHVGAASGLALTYFGLGRDLEGQKALRVALELNPWLSERFLLKPLPGQEL